jgi:hypothetical protein
MEPFMRWLGWWLGWVPRYRIKIHGLESGNVTELHFLVFRTEEEADQWCQKMNHANRETAGQTPLTLFDYTEVFRR